MELREIQIGNFKSLYDASFEPGRLNVFIGANGSGKTTILEAIGLLSAAMTDRVDGNSLQRKGIRLSAPALYKSRFKCITRIKPTVDLAIKWSQGEEQFEYDVHLTTPTDSDFWKYHSEALWQNGEKKWGRSNASQDQRNNNIGFFLLDNNKNLDKGREIADRISNYGIFQPNTLTLRGNIPDPNQMTPIGLNGGRLAEALQEMISEEEGDIKIGSMYLEEILELIDWAEDITIDSPKKTSINSNVPATRQIIEFTDRFMKNAVKFTGYDASEGALYVLFMLCLAMHPKSPDIFAVDSFDHALNPRLARKLTQLFSEQLIEHDKYAFLTTHNPLVLDGLDLQDDRIRLFTVERSKDGFAEIRRIQVTEKLIKEGQSLSRLWINGRLGGVPELL